MLLITLLGYYLLIGVVFAIAFVIAGYSAILNEASGTRFHVRLLWSFAAALLWPLLLVKWIKPGTNRG